LDEIGIDDSHLMLAGEERREPEVADRCLARHEVRAELPLPYPPSKREALMCGVPQSRREMVAPQIHPFLPCDLVADPASITNMARLAAHRAVVDRIERQDRVRQNPGLRSDEALPYAAPSRV